MVMTIIVNVLAVVSLIFISIVFIRKWKYPKKTWINCIVNVLLIPMRQFSLSPFTVGIRPTFQTGMEAAIKETKLTDFGDLEFLDSYDKFFAKADKAFPNLRLTNFAYVSSVDQLKTTMMKRLKLIQYLKDCPDIRNIPVKAPVFIISPPRTGTTFLQRLLAIDPHNRSPLLWELLSPVPDLKASPTYENFREDCQKRCQEWIEKLKIADFLGENESKQIHEYGAELPEECVAGLSDEILFQSTWIYQIFMKADDYVEIFRGKKYQKALTYYKSILQLLSYQIGDLQQSKRWILKAPLHIHFIKDIAAIFPDAKFIFNHRHPKHSVVSLCSLIKIQYEMYYERESFDPVLIGHSLKNVLGPTFLQAHADLQEVGSPVCNVYYDDLTHNPVETIRSLYKEFGWTFTEKYELLLNEFLAKDSMKRQELASTFKASGENRSNRKMVGHDYTPEEFGLTNDDLSTGLFADYCQLYNIPNPRLSEFI